MPVKETCAGSGVGDGEGVKVRVGVGDGRSGARVDEGNNEGVGEGAKVAVRAAKVVVSCPCGTKTALEDGFKALIIRDFHSSTRQARRECTGGRL